MHIRLLAVLGALLLAVSLVACDSSSPPQEETVAEVWEGSYSGVGEQTEFEGSDRETHENLETTLQLAFSDDRELDSLQVKYGSESSPSAGRATRSDVLLLTKDTLLTTIAEIDLGDATLRQQVQLGRDDGLVKGALWRYFPEDPNDIHPDSSVVRFTVSPEPQ